MSKSVVSYSLCYLAAGVFLSNGEIGTAAILFLLGLSQATREPK